MTAHATSSAVRGRVIALRRDLHAHPETGWDEFRTTVLVRDALRTAGVDRLWWGGALYDGVERLGVPDAPRGTGWEWLPGTERTALHGGTGVVADIVGGLPGPMTALRFDLDALPLTEDAGASHRPAREGFASRRDGVAHACGHDGHTAIGLVLADLLVDSRPRLAGTVRLLFQPAEEGARGARALVDAGWLDETERFLAVHLWPALPPGTVAAGVSQMLATTKLDLDFRGRSAHAAIAPHEGANALQAAVSTVAACAALPRMPGVRAQVNIGILHAGRARNVVPDAAYLAMEVRSTDHNEVGRLHDGVARIARGVAEAHDVTADLRIVGTAATAPCDPDLVTAVSTAVDAVGLIAVRNVPLGGSDDAGTMMRRVQELGGSSTYVALGCDAAAPLHTGRFDFDETVLGDAVALLQRVLVPRATASSDPRKD